jgi:23S rRNA (uracil1939-C5)-methyltransferase
MPRRASRDAAPVLIEARVDGLDQDARGVARVDGKVTFIDGALPGERVRAQLRRRKRHLDEAHTVAVLEASAERVVPRCAHFGQCGGCSLQHLAPDAQIRHKRDDLLSKLLHIARVTPARVGAPIRGPLWGYRRKARLGCKHVPGKGGVLVGFRERHSNLLAQITECHVLIPQVGTRIRALREVFDTLDARAAIAQVEVAAGDGAVLLVLRNLSPLGVADIERLRRFSREHGLALALQPAGPDSVHALEPAQLPRLAYRLADFDLDLEFSPLDFVQVNAAVNEALVRRAVDAVAPAPAEPVLDLFCGLGNFSLALARRGARVTGVELGSAMVARARDNAARNAITGVSFHAADLSLPDTAARWAAGGVGKWLLDPPRTGAEALVRAIGSAGAAAPARIVYVSCNPATLARDAGVLVHEQHYRLAEVCVVDMFPHTNHLEAMAVFEHEP